MSWFSETQVRAKSRPYTINECLDSGHGFRVLEQSHKPDENYPAYNTVHKTYKGSEEKSLLIN